MIEALKILTKRPTDKNIRIYKVIFGLVLSLATYYNLIIQWDPLVEALFWNPLNEANVMYIKYAIISVWLFPIITWATDIHLLKAKYNKYFQILTAILLFYIAALIKDSATLEVDTLVGLMWFIALIAGITGKAITTQWLKHGEKITKIRV